MKNYYRCPMIDNSCRAMCLTKPTIKYNKRRSNNMLIHIARFLIILFGITCFFWSYTIWDVTRETLNPFLLRELITFCLAMAGFTFVFFAVTDL
jgi:uncharacterized Tic20 family protein